MHAHSHNMVKKSVARAEALELARKRRDGHEQQNDEKQKRTRRALDTYDDNRTAKNMLKKICAGKQSVAEAQSAAADIVHDYGVRDDLVAGIASLGSAGGSTQNCHRDLMRWGQTFRIELDPVEVVLTVNDLDGHGTCEVKHQVLYPHEVPSLTFPKLFLFWSDGYKHQLIIFGQFLDTCSCSRIFQTPTPKQQTIVKSCCLDTWCRFGAQSTLADLISLEMSFWGQTASKVCMTIGNQWRIFNGHKIIRDFQFQCLLRNPRHIVWQWGCTPIRGNISRGIRCSTLRGEACTLYFLPYGQKCCSRWFQMILWFMMSLLSSSTAS